MAVTHSSYGDVYKLTAASDVLTMPLVIQRIRWVKATTAGHDLEIRTGAYAAEDVILGGTAATTNYTLDVDFGTKPLRVTNLKLQTLGSGVVYVYVA